MRVGFAGLAAASLAGLIAVNVGSPAQAAEDSTLTVKWLGDSGTASAFQPNRDTSGFEYDEFKNISVSVQQTKNLVDQAVVVSVSGFQSGTLGATDGAGSDWTDAMNFMQAMQCWGNPASADFRNTCEWGGKNVANNGLGRSVYSDNVYRLAPRDASPSADTTKDVPFKTVTGETVTGRYVPGAKPDTFDYPLLSYFGPNTTSEVSSARIKDNGTGTFDFQMQSDNTAPQLGCGSPDHLRCWLVLVPRGSVFGGDGQNCSSVQKADLSFYSDGESDAIQGGSPVNTQCHYWDNRIVVPLDFNPVSAACPGGAEQRVVGAQLLIGAFSSWQPKLCTAANGAYSFASNPDSVARDQLLDGDTKLAFSSYPIVRNDLDTDELKNEFDTTTLSYAPVAIGALTISYYAEGPSGRITTLRLTPRLMAKLLTQSYAFEVPGATGEGNGQTHLNPINRSYRLMSDDPDFRAANPDWALYRTNPSLVLPGPSGADAIAQLWKWVQSDADARDFLNGKPDPWKMTVNPYFLPSGNPAALVPQYDDTNTLIVDSLGQPVLKPVGLSFADGSPLPLSSRVIDYFPLADQTEVPHSLTTGIALAQGIRTRIGSLAFLPYANDFPSAAVTTFRANPGARTVWDPSAIDAAGETGAWVSPGPQVPGQRFVIAVTDLASSSQYDLSIAQLGAANGSGFVIPTTQTMAAALTSGLTTLSSGAVKQVDPAGVSADAYPLTTVVYSIVNLTSATKAQLQTYSAMLTYVAGDGQVSGVQPGQLPAGYLPLTADMVNQTRAAATAMASYTPPAVSSGDGAGDGSYSGGGSTPDQVVGEPTKPTVSDLPQVKEPGKTPAVAASPANTPILAISLGVGLLGSILAPVLLRGRREW
jgi:hypothetical protein